MVFRTAPISIPARVVSGGHRKSRLPQGPAVQNRRPLSVSKKSFRLAEASFQNFIKVLKTKDFNGAGHPSWVSRAHPSLPSRRIYHFIDSLPISHLRKKSADPAVRDLDFFAYPNARSDWGRTAHFPRIYFCTKLKNLPLFFLLQLLQKMKRGQKSC